MLAPTNTVRMKVGGWTRSIPEDSEHALCMKSLSSNELSREGGRVALYLCMVNGKQSPLIRMEVHSCFVPSVQTTFQVLCRPRGAHVASVVPVVVLYDAFVALSKEMPNNTTFDLIRTLQLQSESLLDHPDVIQCHSPCHVGFKKK